MRILSASERPEMQKTVGERSKNANFEKLAEWLAGWLADWLTGWLGG
jgi:hypothetical protein